VPLGAVNNLRQSLRKEHDEDHFTYGGCRNCHCRGIPAARRLRRLNRDVVSQFVNQFVGGLVGC